MAVIAMIHRARARPTVSWHPSFGPAACARHSRRRPAMSGGRGRRLSGRIDLPLTPGVDCTAPPTGGRRYTRTGVKGLAESLAECGVLRGGLPVSPCPERGTKSVCPPKAYPNIVRTSTLTGGKIEFFLVPRGLPGWGAPVLSAPSGRRPRQASFIHCPNIRQTLVLMSAQGRATLPIVAKRKANDESDQPAGSGPADIRILRSRPWTERTAC
jgi:hypothetical protein